MKPILVRLEGEREQVAGVAARWHGHYANGGKWGSYINGSTEEVYRRLSALPADATAEDVAAIIGNAAWVGHRCDGCGETRADAWQIGDEPDYESATVVLCAACMERLIAAYQAGR